MAIVSAMPMASKRPQRSKLAKVPAAGLRACVHKYLWYQNTVLQQFLTKVRQSPPPPPPSTDILSAIDQRCTADKNANLTVSWPTRAACAWRSPAQSGPCSPSATSQPWSPSRPCGRGSRRRSGRWAGRAPSCPSSVRGTAT